MINKILTNTKIRMKIRMRQLIKLISHSPLWLILFAVASLLILHPVYDFDWYAEKRIVQISILTLLFFSISFSSIVRHNILTIISNFSLPIKLSIVTFFSLGIASSIISQFPLMAFLEVSNLFLLALLALFISNSRFYFGKSIDIFFIAVFVACSTGYMVSFFSAFTAGIITGTNIDSRDLIMGVVNRRFLNQFQSLSFPFLLIAPLLIADTKKIARLFLLFLASFWFMLMILTDGRGVIIATITGVILSGLLFRRQNIWWKYGLIVTASGTMLYLFVSWLISFSAITISSGDVLRQNTGGRSIIWESVIPLIQDSPLLGIGPIHFSLQPNYTVSPVAHPHNITLQLLSEWGIPATLIIIGLFVYAFRKWIQQQQKTTNAKQYLFSLALTSSFIAALTHGQLSGVFVMPLSQLTFVLISGWMMGIYFKDRTNTLESPRSIVASSLLLSTSLIALITIYYVALPQLRFFINKTPQSDIYLQEFYPNLIDKYPINSFPRYWNNSIHSSDSESH